MKKIILFLFTISVSLFFGQVPTFQWAKSLGTYGTIDVGYSIVTDPSGNVYTTGTFNSVLDMDPGPGTSTVSAGWAQNCFISKLDVNGNYVWGINIGDTLYNNSAYAMAIDAANNIYVTGFFYDTVDFDPGPGTFTMASSSNANYHEDDYILKLDANGNFIWAKKLGGYGGGDPYSITIDGSGNIYTVGYFWGTTDLDPGTGTYTINSAGSSWDIFISKLDPNGNFIYGRAVGSNSMDIAYGIKTDASGNAYITGQFFGNVDFDPGPTTNFLSSGTTTGAFLLKLDAAGNFLSAKTFTNNGGANSRSVSLDNFGNKYLSGTFAGPTDFDPGIGIYTLIPGSGSYGDAFVVKLDASENFVWAKQMPANANCYVYPYTSAVDLSGNFYYAGNFVGTVDLDPGIGSSTFTTTSTTDEDIFISKLNAAGNFVWAGSIGSKKPDIANSIYVDAAYNIYTTGCFRDTVDCDIGPSTYTIATPQYATSILIHKMNQPPLVVNELNNESGLNIYPNPNNGSFTIELNSTALITINNVFGEKIFDQALTSGKQKINLEDPSSGIYFVIIREKDKAPLTQRIVITK